MMKVEGCTDSGDAVRPDTKEKVPLSESEKCETDSEDVTTCRTIEESSNTSTDDDDTTHSTDIAVIDIEDTEDTRLGQHDDNVDTTADVRAMINIEDTEDTRLGQYDDNDDTTADVRVMNPKSVVRTTAVLSRSADNTPKSDTDNTPKSDPDDECANSVHTDIETAQTSSNAQTGARESTDTEADTVQTDTDATIEDTDTNNADTEATDTDMHAINADTDAADADTTTGDADMDMCMTANADTETIIRITRANTENTDSGMADGKFDHYGFLLDESDTDSDRCYEYHKRPEYGQDLICRWRTMLKEENWQKYHKSSGKIRSYIQSGVPDCLRGELWMKLLDGEMLAMKANFSYKANVVAVREQLVELGICEFRVTESLNVLGNLKDVSIEGQKHNSTHTYIHCDTLRQIFCDVERTYPTHRFFLNHSCNGQEGCAALFRVLAVYARYNRHVGYCQGMSYLAGLLLMQMSEVEAFWCLVALFERQKYLQGFYDNSLMKMKSYAAVFKKLMSHRLPALTQHLRDLELQPLMFLTPWFMCVFTDLPCWDTVLTIWDLFMLDGVSTLFRVALAVMETFETDLLNLEDLSTLLPELLHLPSHICEYETLVPAILGTNIEPWEVRSLLAVISEEETIRLNHRKRVLSENSDNLPETDAKRQRIQGTESSSPSIFRRLVNFFTGRSSNPGAKRSHPSHTQRLLQRQYTARAFKRKHIQSANSVNLHPSEEFGGTPRTPTDENMAHSRAIEEFSFKLFNTPAPLRWNQGRQSSLPIGSPEVEMEHMTSK